MLTKTQLTTVPTPSEYEQAALTIQQVFWRTVVNSEERGWRCDQRALIVGCGLTKATQATDDAMNKATEFFRIDAERFLEEILARVKNPPAKLLDMRIRAFRNLPRFHQETGGKYR